MKKKYSTEFNQKAKAQGYTMKTNLNAGYIRLVDEVLKNIGEKTADAIKQGNAKEAIRLVRDGKMQRDSVRREIEKADKVVYDKDGNSIAWFHTQIRKCYELEN